MIIERPALYLVGTPIGNLSDLSPRALELLGEADFIAAEDTRVSGNLLRHFGIKKPIVSYFEHNIRERGEQIVARLKEGQCCALVTDAGMPAISDPGEDLVRLCAENGIPVHSVPGPTAVITALALSGLPTGRFTFEGFLSTTRKSRVEHLSQLKTEQRTMIFYEAPHKLQKTLTDLLETFGHRKISICRELTKLHEEVIRTTLAEAIQYYEQQQPKGEFVLVLEGYHPTQSEEIVSEEDRNARVISTVETFIAEGCSRNEAIKKAAAALGLSRNETYSMYQQSKQTD